MTFSAKPEHRIGLLLGILVNVACALCLHPPTDVWGLVVDIIEQIYWWGLTLVGGACISNLKSIGRCLRFLESPS